MWLARPGSLRSSSSRMASVNGGREVVDGGTVYRLNRMPPGGGKWDSPVRTVGSAGLLDSASNPQSLCQPYPGSAATLTGSTTSSTATKDEPSGAVAVITRRVPIDLHPKPYVRLVGRLGGRRAVVKHAPTVKPR